MIWTPDDWDGTCEWMSLEERNDRVDEYVWKHRTKEELSPLYERLANDFEFCCQTLFTTHDPRSRIGKVPFRLYDYEAKLGKCLEDCIVIGFDLKIPKSRDMGVTWEILAKLVQHLLFDDDFHALITSRKKDLIDSKTNPNTLFERLRILLRYMPKHLKKRLLTDEFSEARHAVNLRITNPLNGNTITGEAPVEDFGRQGRYSTIFFDEAGLIDELQDMINGTTDCTKSRIFASNPYGMNTFYHISKDPRTITVPVHWSQHPKKRVGLRKSEKIQGADNILKAIGAALPLQNQESGNA